MQTIARSRSPWGPFEPAPHNPVITHRNRTLHPIQTLGHADLVQDPRGQWWALTLGTRHREQHHNLGRETFLMPVVWADGWPHIGTDGGTEIANRHPAGPQTGGAGWPVARTLWTDGWHSRGPPLAGMALAGDDVLLPCGAGLAEDAAGDPPGALFRFQTEEVQSFAALIPDPPEGHAAGIAVISDPRHHYSLALLRGDGGRVARFRRVIDDLATETTHPLPPEGPVRFRIMATPEAYAFAAEVGGDTIAMGQGSARLMSAEACEWFVGVNFALFATGPGRHLLRFGAPVQG
jgi:alpha-N-arabinofuranosidase